MKTLLTVAVLATLGTAISPLVQAQTPQPGGGGPELPAICVQNQEQNAQIVARAKSAPDAKTRIAILQEALRQNPENAICLMELMMQLQLAGTEGDIEPAAGDETVTTEELGTTTSGLGGTGENPDQLNTPEDQGTVSPAAPSSEPSV